MRRITTLIFLFIVFTFSIVFANAQQSAQKNFNRYKKNRKALGPNFQITPFAGFNGMNYQENTLSVQGQEQSFGTEPENGSNVGILVDYNTSFYGIGLQTGIVFSRYLSSFNLVDANKEVNFEYEDSYISVPLNLKIYPFSRAGQWFYMKGGVNLSLLTDSKETVRERTFSTQQLRQADADNKNAKKDTDVQMVVGGGVNIRLSDTMGLNLEGNYHHGLVDTRAQTSDDNSIPEFKTQGYSAVFGLSFLL